MCISLAGLRRRVVAYGLREVRLLGEHGLGVFLRGRLGLGLGLTALAVLLRLRVLFFPYASLRPTQRQQQDAQRKNGR